MGIFTTRNRLTQLVIVVFVLQASLFVLKVDARNPSVGVPGGGRPGGLYKRWLGCFGCEECGGFEEECGGEDMFAECENNERCREIAAEECENLDVNVCCSSQEAFCCTNAECESEAESMSCKRKRQFGCFGGCGGCGCNDEEFMSAECENEECCEQLAFEECENLDVNVCCSSQEAFCCTTSECENEDEFSRCGFKRSPHMGGNQNRGSHFKRFCGDDFIEAHCFDEACFDNEAFEECENLNINVCCSEQEAFCCTTSECESEDELFDCGFKRSYPGANRNRMYKRSRGPAPGNMRPYYKRSRGTSQWGHAPFAKRRCGFGNCGDDFDSFECFDEACFDNEAFESCENLEANICCSEQEAFCCTNSDCFSDADFFDCTGWKRSGYPSNGGRSGYRPYKRSLAPSRRPYKRSLGRGANAPSNSRYYRRSFGQPARSPSRGALYKRFGGLCGPCDGCGFLCDPFDPFFDHCECEIEECDCENDGCVHVCNPIDINWCIDQDAFCECNSEDCDRSDVFGFGFPF